jgi:hypothetical protein
MRVFSFLESRFATLVGVLCLIRSQRAFERSALYVELQW